MAQSQRIVFRGIQLLHRFDDITVRRQEILLKCFFQLSLVLLCLIIPKLQIVDTFIQPGKYTAVYILLNNLLAILFYRFDIQHQCAFFFLLFRIGKNTVHIRTD